MARRRRSSLSGSPAHHAREGSAFAKEAVSLYKASSRESKKKACFRAFQLYGGAMERDGISIAHYHETNKAGPKKALEEAQNISFHAFVFNCLKDGVPKIAGMRRRTRRK